MARTEDEWRSEIFDFLFKALDESKYSKGYTQEEVKQILCDVMRSNCKGVIGRVGTE